jgi:hypothetical protein
MRQLFYIETESIFQKACALRSFGASGDLSWREWYNWNVERTRMSAGELEQAVAEALDITFPARDGFAVTSIDHECVIVTDLEENGNCDLTDPDDEHLVVPVQQFREWLYGWGKKSINRVMGTDEAACLWGLSQQRIKVLCSEGKVEARLIGKQWILNRNQPNPKQR